MNQTHTLKQIIATCKLATDQREELLQFAAENKIRRGHADFESIRAESNRLSSVVHGGRHKAAELDNGGGIANVQRFDTEMQAFRTGEMARAEARKGKARDIRTVKAGDAKPRAAGSTTPAKVKASAQPMTAARRRELLSMTELGRRALAGE